jgi:hypothetical protein
MGRPDDDTGEALWIIASSLALALFGALLLSSVEFGPQPQVALNDAPSGLSAADRH